MKSGIGRRDVLKSFLATAAGLSIGRLSHIRPFAKTGAIAGEEEIPMPERPLGKTGYKTRLFSLGGETTVQQRDQKEKALEIISKALDSGVNYIDTSHVYGGGGSEENIGEIMAERRDEVFLATKTGRYDYDGAMRESERSLKRLRTDFIDLYQHHAVDRESGVDQITGEGGALEAFRKLREEGVIGHLGISSHSPRILMYALEKYDYDCCLISINPAGMSMRETEYMDDFFSMAEDKGVGVIGMKVAGKGRMFRRGINIQQALTYTLSYPISTAIVGITEPEQIEENVEIAKNFTQLSEEKKRALEDELGG